jgi:hypothetical protein
MAPFSISGLLANVERMATVTEQDVLQTFATIAAGGSVIQTEVEAAHKWLVNMAPTVATDLQLVLTIFQAMGVTMPPGVLTEVESAVAGLQGIVNGVSAGVGLKEAVVSGVVAMQGAIKAKAAAIASVAPAI